MKKYLFFLICSAFATCVNGQVIYTKAGNGGNPGDYLQATSASLAYPTGVFVDGNGNIYIADQTYNRIRKVTAATGQISTIAGTGVAGFSGDGGKAINAQLRSPWAVTVDNAGNVLVVDEFNHRIRKIDGVTGIITTIAGTGIAGFSGDAGAATSAQLNYPNGITVDAAGNIFIADYFNHRIRKINASDGKINTVAGTNSFGFSGDGGAATAAQLNSPTDVAVDAAGNIYISDKSNNRIRRVNIADGIISTFAGSGATTYTGDGGQATAAGVSTPLGVADDAAGNIYFSDNGHSVVRKVAPGGIITTVAGNGTNGFSGDGGAATAAMLASPHQVAVNAAGDLFIMAYGNFRVRKVSGGIITTVAGNGTISNAGQNGPAETVQFNSPTGVALDGTGNLFIADFNNSRIHRVNAADGIITTIAGKGDGGIGGFDGDGGQANVAQISHPNGITIDGSGNLFIADRYNHRIRKMNLASGIITTVAGSGPSNASNMGAFSGDGGLATAARLNNPFDVAVDAAGNIYIADDLNHRVRKVNATTNIITTIAGTGTANFSGDGGQATLAQLNFPVGVAVDAAGNVYIADAGNNRIRKINIADGTISTIVGTGATGSAGDGGNGTAATLNLPEGIELDASGNLYISEFGSHKIRKLVLATNIISAVAGAGFQGYGGDGDAAVSARLFNPLAMAVNATNLYVADAGNNRIRSVCISTNLASVSSVDSLIALPNTFANLPFADNCSEIGIIYPSGANPVVGNITGKVFIESSVQTFNGEPYVQRHYEVMPRENASTSTASLILHFTQAEFTAYNASPLVVNGMFSRLPINAQDVENNRANIRINKKAGISNNGSGLPETYTGASTTITPYFVDWNAVANRWDVYINVVGFSGFFAQSTTGALPLTWLNVSAKINALSQAQVTWQVQEQNVAKYEIEKSASTTSFTAIASVISKGDGTFNYDHTEPIALQGTAYYRIKQTGKDGSIGYSKVLMLRKSRNEIVSVFPNPSPRSIVVSGVSFIKRMEMINSNGQLVKAWNGLQQNTVLDISTVAPGVYTLKIINDEFVETLKLVKQ